MSRIIPHLYISAYKTWQKICALLYSLSINMLASKKTWQRLDYYKISFYFCNPLMWPIYGLTNKEVFK